jgi:hypothetical protein
MFNIPTSGLFIHHLGAHGDFIERTAIKKPVHGVSIVDPYNHRFGNVEHGVQLNRIAKPL